jgi:multiple sugar transport system permease protein
VLYQPVIKTDPPAIYPSGSTDWGGRKRRTFKGLRELSVAVPFMLPGLLLLVVFVLWPLVRGVQMSMYDWNLMVPDQSIFVGADNLVRALTDSSFWVATRNTVLYAVVTVPGQIVLGLAAALGLHSHIRGKVLFRTLYYLPVVTSWLVVSFIFRFLFTDGLGPVNYLLVDIFHVADAPIPWLHQTWTAQVPIILLGIWKGVGWNMVIFLAALATMPAELLDAAAVDGAGRWDRFRYVTLPLLKPTILFITVVLTIGAFNVFLSVFLLTGGGPERSTEVLLTYMYTQAFRFLDFGYGVTIGLLLGALVVTMGFLQRRILRGAVEY